MPGSDIVWRWKITTELVANFVIAFSFVSALGCKLLCSDHDLLLTGDVDRIVVNSIRVDLA